MILTGKLSILIKYNTTETPKIDNMINFYLKKIFGNEKIWNEKRYKKIFSFLMMNSRIVEIRVYHVVHFWSSRPLYCMTVFIFEVYH